MAAFIMSMQLELGKSEVRIVDLEPGDIHTNFNEAVSKGSEAGYGNRVAKTWVAVDRNLKAGPKPDLVAQHILKLIDRRNPPGRILVGDAFQTKIAPFILRFLPQRTRLWGLRKYYGI
jgi:NAD(P)-dependent dehydrogenase (short-subunit alcohol dehydrogenase family)